MSKKTVNEDKSPPGELEILQNLIFGNQARETSRRLADIETRLNESSQELRTVINNNQEIALTNSNDQSASVRKELTQRINRQHEELTGQINQVQQDLTNQLRKLQSELSEQITKMGNTQQERLQAASEESRERDDSLRQELLTLTTWLDD
ncbi:MAG: hypothetical protein GY761_09025, partial [Hyphomicrobiales bacterium]|nr:hypothetical protein [Hyphomicrobiales bacterium]